MPKVFHAFPFRQHSSQPVNIDEQGSCAGGNVFQGIDSVYYYDMPGTCLIDIACCVSLTAEEVDNYHAIKAFILSNGEHVGQREIPFFSDRITYQYGDLYIYQWKKQVEFKLSRAGVIACHLQFCGEKISELIENIFQASVMFGPNPALEVSSK